MSSTEVGHSEASRPPRIADAKGGVYRPTANPADPGTDGDPTAATSSSHAQGNAVPSHPVDAMSADARRRFHQLRLLRRELAGRPLTPDTSSPPQQSVALNFTHSPVPASFGVALDRLPPADPATRHILRTAAAERALRQLQAENDEWKRVVVAQRHETEHLRAQLERLSGELAASGQTVLRQTATMRSLTSEIERQDAYHLIKERRESIIPEVARQRVEALEAQVAQLTAEKAALGQQLADTLQRAAITPPSVEAIERDDDDEEKKVEGEGAATQGGHADAGWMLFAAEELQRLVLTFGSIVSSSHSGSAAVDVAAAVVFQVELSELSFAAPSARPHYTGGGRVVAATSTAGVLTVCGPYHTNHLLLRRRLSGLPPLTTPAMWRRASSAAECSDVCCFYAVSDTDAVLTLRFESKAAEGDQLEEGAAPSTLEMTAIATVPVRSLLTTATVRDGCAAKRRTPAATVHTVHLHREGETVSSGAASFIAAVSVVTPLSEVLPRSRGYHRAAPAPETVRDSLLQTPLGQAVSATKAMACASSVQHRTPLLSPSRDGEASAVVPHRRRLSSLSSNPSGAATPNAPGSDPQPLVAEVSVGREASGWDERAAAPVPAPAPSDAAPVREAEQPLKIEGDASPPLPSPPSLPSPSLAAAAPLPPMNCAPAAPTLLPLPPLVRVPEPPTPQPSVMDTPGEIAARTALPEASVAESVIGVCVHVRCLALLCGGTSEDVEDMLDACAVTVSVLCDQKHLVITTPHRVLPRAQWSAEEGRCRTTLKATQTLCFEVRDVSAAVPGALLAQSTLRVSEVDGKWGPRELTLVSVKDDAECGQLTVDISPDS